MALSKSAVANRRALHFDYYRMPKTATPLNEACTRTRKFTVKVRDATRDDARTPTQDRTRLDRRGEHPRIEEISME